MWKSLFVLTTGILLAAPLLVAASVYDYELNSINYERMRLRDFQGKVLLIVNVASQCGYTPQYATLETLYRRYKDQGFVILGVPSNDFGQGEPGTDPEIKQFCRRKYDVTFPMSSKVTIGGNNPLPLYEYLTDKSKNPPTGGNIQWNFTKFLIGRKGTVLARFEPRVAPDDPVLVKAVEKALQ
jgi:glutathione peroxidase